MEVIINFKGCDSKSKIMEYFKDWFSNSGEFKFLDYIDSADPNFDYSNYSFEIYEKK